VLLALGLPVLVAAAYLASIEGHPWLGGAAALMVPVLLTAVLGYLLPGSGSYAGPKGSGVQHQDADGLGREWTHELAAVAEVARATTSILDPSVLLPQVVELVRDRFGLYYVGLFLVDEDRSFAMLEAGTGRAGREMLAKRHRLEVGGESMIGQCVATGEPGVQLDVGSASVRFDNPLLPETRSELALPLRARERVIGALTVQSAQANAFDETILVVLQALADQIGVAIDNARLFAEGRAALGEMESIQQRYTARAWREYVASGMGSAAVTLGSGDVDDEAIEVEVRTALDKGATAVIPARTLETGAEERYGHATLVVPIKLRGRAIGVLGFHDQAGRDWSEPDILLAEAVAERLAMSAENLRLLDATQRKAAYEQLIGRIGRRVREAPDLGGIMTVAAEALGEELDASEVVFRLGTAASLLNPSGVE
jgi:GAF domain-containing protein